MSAPLKKIHLQYYALLREERGLNEETIETAAPTARDLYEDLKKKYHFRLSPDLLRVAVNNEFCPWGKELRSGDTVVFIPPVAGG
jgi:molybdopterin converting factor small subunit